MGWLRYRKRDCRWWPWRGGEPRRGADGLSTVPAGVVHDGQRYLVEGGPANVRELYRFFSDTVLLTGEGFESPVPTPAYGVYGDHEHHADRPTVGVVFYRAHVLAGNTGFVDTPCTAIEAVGGNALAVYVYTIGDFPEDGDALIHQLIAAGGHDVEWLTDEQLAGAPIRVPAALYRGWFDELPEALRHAMRAHWGEPPGELYVDGGDIVLAGLRLGEVVAIFVELGWRSPT